MVLKNNSFSIIIYILTAQLLTQETAKLPSYRNHRANQLAGFYMMATLVFNELNELS